MKKIKQKNFRSEYSKSYNFNSTIAEENYNENLKFRQQRRNDEICHQPLYWEQSESENESDSEPKKLVVNNNCPLLKEESTQVNNINSRGHNEDDGYDTDGTNSNFDASGSLSLNNNYVEQVKLLESLKHRALERAKQMKRKTLELRKSRERRKESEELNMTEDEELKMTTKNTKKREVTPPERNDIKRNNSHNRPQHPVKGSQNRVLSAPQVSNKEPKKTKTLNDINKEKSFIPYGCGTPSDDFHHKKTFNVNSRVDVHQSALRASKQRQIEKIQRQKKQQQFQKQQLGPKFVGRGDIRSACSAKSISCDEANNAMAGRNDKKRQSTKGKFNGLDDNSAWMSEYQNKFPIYDNEVYRKYRANVIERGITSRLDTPRTCRI